MANTVNPVENEKEFSTKVELKDIVGDISTREIPNRSFEENMDIIMKMFGLDKFSTKSETPTTTEAKAASENSSDSFAKKRPSKEQREKLQGKRESIGTSDFNMKQLVSDTNNLVDFYGFDKSVKVADNDDENEIYLKVLDIIDILVSAVKVLPADSNPKAVDTVKSVASIMKKYVPDFATIAKLSAIVPGMAEYTNSLQEFGKSIDKAIEIMKNAEPDQKAIAEACDTLKAGIAAAKKVKINELQRAAKAFNIKNNPLMNSEQVADAAAFNQQQLGNIFDANPANPFAWAFKSSHSHLENAPMEVPSILDGSISGPVRDPKQMPAIVTENTMHIPQTNIEQMVFSPVNSQAAPDVFHDYPFVQQIIDLAASVGYNVVPYPILDDDKRISLILFHTFKDNVFLQDKSFVVDLGVVIDSRYGVWNCVNPDGSYHFLEECDVAYGLKAKDGSFNEEFMKQLFKVGFSSIPNDLRDRCTLYRDRMTITNRRINLIGTQAIKSKDVRNMIRGCCIRMATKLDPSYGRFEFKSVDEKAMSFVLTNENVYENYLGQKVPHRFVEIHAEPKVDENGKHIPVSKTGNDIEYLLVFVFNKEEDQKASA